MNADLEKLLARQPVNEPVIVDGETAYLRIGNGGAELGVHLINNYSAVQIEDAMKKGFQSALEFEAGLACSADGTILVLSRWLPDVGNWTAAVPFLESLLNQLSAWRAMMAAPAERRIENTVSGRTEQRLRALLAGGKG